MKKIISLTLIAIVIGLTNCKKEEVSLSACSEVDMLEEQRLDIVKKIQEKYAYEPLFKRRFDQERVAWTQYTTRRLRALYPRDWDRVYRKEFGKEEFNDCKCKELVRLKKMRIIELEYYLDGSPDNQNECPSLQNE